MIFWWKLKKLVCFEHSIFFDAFSWVLIHHKIIKSHHVLHTSGLARLSLFLFFLFLTSMFFSVSHIVGPFLTSLFPSLLSGSCLCFLCLSWPAMGKHIVESKCNVFSNEIQCNDFRRELDLPAFNEYINKQTYRNAMLFFAVQFNRAGKII